MQFKIFLATILVSLWGINLSAQDYKAEFKKSGLPVIFSDSSDTELKRKTAFEIECSEEGLEFRVELSDLSAKKDAVEIFFKVDDSLPANAFYQFYGEFPSSAKLDESLKPALASLGLPYSKDMAMVPFYYAESDAQKFPFLKAYQSWVKKTDNGLAVSVLLPWNGLLRILPFDDDGKGKSWRLNIVRCSDDKDTYYWHGTSRRNVSEWAILKFPDLTKEELSSIYARIITQNTSAGPLAIEQYLFDPDSIPAAQMNAKKAQKQLGDSKCVGFEEIKGNALKSDSFLYFTDPVASVKSFPVKDKYELPSWSFFAVSGNDEVPISDGAKGLGVYDEKGMLKNNYPRPGFLPAADKGTGKQIKLRMEYTFERRYSGDLYLSDFSAAAKAGFLLRYEIALNGKNIYANTDNEHLSKPANILIGKIMANDKISITFHEANGEAGSFKVAFKMDEFQYGLRPRAAQDILSLDPALPCPALDQEKRISAHFLERHLMQVLDALRMKPLLLMAGSTLIDGFGFSGLYAEMLRQYRLCDIAIVGNYPPNVMWQLEYGSLELVKPKLMVVEPGRTFARTTLDESCAAVRGMIRIIRRKTPGTQILLLGCLPPHTLKIVTDKEEFIQFNQMLSQLAKEEDVLFRDPSASFINPDKTIKTELYKVPFLSEEGYRLWAESFISDAAKICGPNPQ
ncbi:MAG: hypothetical protein A2X49_07515 [Lentisphaerae bacterium GWF2_52_8]|nr:MAG: hypothetical protein A2X49_07515 [Lentisphaerae bacterium GWF2_52_8]